MKIEKPMKKFIVFTVLLAVTVFIVASLFSELQYQNVTINSIKDIENYSNFQVDSETQDFLTVTARTNNGEKVRFVVDKSSEVYKPIYLSITENPNFLSTKNLLKLLLLGIIILVGLLYINKTKLDKKEEPDSSNTVKLKNSVSTTNKENNFFEFTESDVKFDDIAGYDYVKEEMQEIVDQLKNPSKYQKLGAKMIKGGIFYGPPGTGKTFFAKALAGETDVPFISVSGSDFVEQYVGTGPSRVRELFALAKQKKTCIIFIDEIDALGGKRSGDSNSREYDNTVNALLVELQGFKSDDYHIVVFGATNKIETLDPALIRPGRLDRKIEIGLPDKETRLTLLKHFTTIENRNFADDCDLESISNLTYNFAAADLEKVVNEAILLAARQGVEVVTQRHILDAFDKVSLGIKTNRTLSEKDKQVVAVHEAGHAVVTKYLNPNDIIQKVTILPQGQALGMVQKTPDEEVMLSSKEELINEVKILLAGRVAEEVFFDSITTGAENDLKVATNIISSMLFKYGMYDNLVYVENELDYDTVNNVLKQYYQEVKKLIQDELYSKIDLVSKILLKKEYLSGKDLDKIFNEIDKIESQIENKAV